ncbi:hypothetical protein LAZ67_2006555 [Cordylochernes scorpioides]|uniref:Uncharacterized protein n=1 Tax=Cordylochernes scorpioides TaxID=51811 RepID=A0ABY6K8B8_9ARAC|nr:hypothetical protein LAZ67_2006555 [Cordylochernes scorpioides]
MLQSSANLAKVQPHQRVQVTKLGSGTSTRRGVILAAHVVAERCQEQQEVTLMGDVQVFASCEVPLDLQDWLFGDGLHPEAMKLTSVAKATIYKYHLGLELGNVSHNIDLPTLWERTLAVHRWWSLFPAVGATNDTTFAWGKDAISERNTRRWF